jgi:hypothetical protein
LLHVGQIFREVIDSILRNHLDYLVNKEIRGRLGYFGISQRSVTLRRVI